MKVKTLIKVIIGIIIILIIIISGQEAFASDIDGIIDEQSDVIEYDEIQQAFDFALNEEELEFDFKEMINGLIAGDYDLEESTLITIVIKEIFKDLSANISIMVQLLIVTIGAAILKSFSDSFDSKEISEVSYFIVFMVIMGLVLQSYHLISLVAVDVVDNLLVFIEALVPSLIGITVLSGGTVSSVIVEQGIIMAIGIIDNLIKTVFLPFLYIILIFIILNTLTEDGAFTKMIKLFKKIFEWGVKILLIAFIGVFSFKSFTLPMIDGIVTKTAKQAITVVPVVGTSLAEVSDIVFSCGNVIQNAFGIGAIIAILVICAIPVIKIIIIATLYKFIAAIIQPISDIRLGNCLSQTGDVCFLLFGIVLIVVAMFIITIGITLYITNSILYIR